jgi:putative peptide zinc metalloprotease protein
VTVVRQSTGPIAQVQNSGAPCSDNATTASIAVNVSDKEDGSAVKGVRVTWGGFAKGSQSLSRSGTLWTGSVGPVDYPGADNRGGSLTVTVTATDTGGKTGGTSAQAVTVAPCTVIIIG